MHILLDHLTATMVGMAVVVVLIGVGLGGQSGAVQETQRAVNQERARALALLLEDDIRNAGSGLGRGDAAVTLTDAAALGVRLKTDFGDSPVREIVYQRRPTGSVMVGDETLATFAAERWVDGVLAQEVDGLTELTFELRDADGAATADPDAGRAVQVRFTVGTGTDNGTDIDTRVRYRRTTVMQNLTN